MENRYAIDYDIKQRFFSNIKFMQGDIDSSVLEVTIFDNSKNVDMTGEDIEFRFLKPDGTIVFQDKNSGVNFIDAAKGEFECVLKANTLASVGVVRCEIIRKKNGIILTCPSFNFTVDSSIGGLLLSSNYIASIENKMIEWNANETSRQTRFENNEIGRNDIFNYSQSAKQNTFNVSEAGRQNTFNTNENARQNTFNTNETQRNTNETNRQNRFNSLTTAQQQASEVIDSRTSTFKNKTFANLDLRLEDIEKDTPKITDKSTNKTYSFKIQIVNNKPQLVYEEVI